MPERRKLTKEVLNRLRLPIGAAEHTVWDSELKGFGVRLREGGSRNFIVKFRVGGRSRQITIGPASPDGLGTARAAAAKALQHARDGVDPQAARSQRHEEARETLGVLIKDYLAQAERRLRPKSLVEVKRHLEVAWKPLHARAARSVTKADIVRRLDELTETKGATTSNRARTTLSAMYSWAIQRDRASANPVIGTEANAERSRDRVLTPAELCAIWTACEDEAEYGRIIRLLILTGCRRQEVGDMSWSELTADHTVWTIPAGRTKNKLPHIVTLSSLARTILEDQPRRPQQGPGAVRGQMREFVFGEGRGGYSGWTRSKWRLDARIARANAKAGGRMEPAREDQPASWTLHDLRRTFATVCAERLGVPPHVIEACLNHVERRREGVAGIYNRATYAEPMAKAWLVYAAWIDEIVTGGVTTNVVALHR